MNAGRKNAMICYMRKLVAVESLSTGLKNSVKLFLVLFALLGRGMVAEMSRITELVVR